MVFFNWATMQMAAKIVYYGPGLCGKTTNLSFLYGKTAPGSRGEMVSLETETDRTLFFDLLPLEVGKVGGFRTRLQLYTVPGQVFYNTTRKLVLKGVDGIVFVADSQRPMAEANVESFRNLEDNLRELGLEVDVLPLVLQYNKRDLKNILTVEELNTALNPRGVREYFEAVAVQGDGVFETLKAITKNTLRSLRRRMAAQEGTPAVAVQVAAPTRPSRPFSPSGLSAAAEQGLASPAGDEVGEGGVDRPMIAAAEPLPVADEGVAEEQAGPPDESLSLEEISTPEAPPEESRLSVAEELDASGEDVLPEAEELPDAAEADDLEPDDAEPAAQHAAAVEQPEAGGLGSGEDDDAGVEFATTAGEDGAVDEPEMRHVRVSSSLDILAELENLRKAATSHSDDWRRGGSSTPFDLDSLLQSSLNSRQEVKRRIDENVGDALGQARRCRVTIELVDDTGHRVRKVAPLEVELKNEEQLRQLSLTLTVDLRGE